MLNAGFDIEARADDLDATGLLYAASNGDVAMVEFLLARGAKVDVKQKYGGTPLRTAIYCAVHFPRPNGRYAHTVRMLAQAGDKVTDDRLRFAIDNGLSDIADVLKSHGASL
jgi:ankyrin repeat protein